VARLVSASSDRCRTSERSRTPAQRSMSRPRFRRSSLRTPPLPTEDPVDSPVVVGHRLWQSDAGPGQRAVVVPGALVRRRQARSEEVPRGFAPRGMACRPASSVSVTRLGRSSPLAGARHRWLAPCRVARRHVGPGIQRWRMVRDYVRVGDVAYAARGADRLDVARPESRASSIVVAG
jgi:hypothetical protein